MAVTQRLRELRAAGKHELADTLAVEALRNERPTVTRAGDHVRVSTRTFAGEHALSSAFDPTDEASVREALARRGTYGLADHDGRTFTTGALYDAVVAAMLDDGEESASSDTVAESTPAPSVDTGTEAAPDPADADEQVGPVGPAESSRRPTAVLRQAVAAVQSQFRN
ncbi:hypothetical protein [Halomarina oriensis]|uniref:Uncharacterized protein n=1 Tax=Halomarina oriensis TaxID=671145 RepID=A0A6B0GX53_9EURY|nr:hypothetical protein [Halomarina oriensis]MWG36338.1 hypothetical protein [Halomarina oriensis]